MNSENENNQLSEKEAKDEAVINEAAEEFISEFAPEPIKIPNYNKKKALAKSEKVRVKKKKKNSKKSKKRRKMLKKIVAGIRAVLIFLLLLTVIITTISVLVVKLNTSEYAVASAIRTHEPERFIIGDIKDNAKLNLKESSSRASLADILRDNSMITVTYDDIEQAVAKSSYPDYIAKKTHEVINHYLYGKSYREITANEVSELILDNVSYIKLVTGQELGDTACDALGAYIVKSPALKEVSSESLAKQPLAKYTYITSIVLSMPTLIVLVIALLLLLVLTAITCSGFVHKMIGWACMIAGVFVCAFITVSRFFFDPLYKPATEFVRGVVNAIRGGFESSALICGGLIFLIGLIVLLIGHAMTDDYDEGEESIEADYIDEIEQVSTAQ